MPNIVFCGSPLDRASRLRRDAHALAEARADRSSRYLVLAELKPLIRLGETPQIRWLSPAEIHSWLPDDGIDSNAAVFLGLHDGIAHFALAVAPDKNLEGDGNRKFIDVRSIAPELSVAEAAILALARSLIDWHARHGFCPACGGKTAAIDGGFARRCESCLSVHFPRTDPVVIMLILHRGRLLLGRQPGFAPGVYSALAGFIEPGESIEEAVRREAQEEAGVTIGSVRYLASQPWPFPSSLMIGCEALALTDAIKLDRSELEDARWFTREDAAAMLEASTDRNAPLRLPPPLSLAHQLAKLWLASG
jgi:NAD+ diphosphatase